MRKTWLMLLAVVFASAAYPPWTCVYSPNYIRYDWLFTHEEYRGIAWSRLVLQVIALSAGVMFVHLLPTGTWNLIKNLPRRMRNWADS